MRVIGTAGHVDHGKTALIRAMTGIDADRLPEEKARGMTTDLGFAFYEGGNGQTIGVVDVPGHERYLRNMVAGAWGLDLVVLVVAADDGWMPQSGLHASIVASLAAPAVVIAVTKTDAVEPSKAEAVALDAVERASLLFGFTPPFVLVSGITGEGIAELKSVIDRELAARPEASGTDAYLFVDRAFTPTGGGVVVTGTLKGGSLSVGDELSIMPRGEKLRLRGIQTYHAPINRAEPTCRAALSLSGVKNGIERGDLLAFHGASMFADTEFLCILLPLPGTETLCPLDQRGRPMMRSGLEAELAIGTARSDIKIYPLRTPGFIRVRMDKVLACPAFSPCAILRHGGAELLGRGYVLEAGNSSPESRKALDSILQSSLEAAGKLAAGHTPITLYVQALSFSLRVLRDGRAPAGQDIFSEGWPIEAVASAGFELAQGQNAAPVAFDAVTWKQLSASLIKAASAPGGMSNAGAEAAYAQAMGSGWRRDSDDTLALSAALARLEFEGSITRTGPGWRSATTSRDLSPDESAILQKLSAAGKAGLEPGKSTAQTDSRILKALCSFERAVPLDGNIFFARTVYDSCVQSILFGTKAGERFSVPMAKERSGLSRKYILPLLNRMESQGFVKRSDDDRVVLRLPSDAVSTDTVR
jgi:selenocysteine-specific elongation factor